MPSGDTRVRAILLSTVLVGCAGHPWPDEPGVPVALSRAANVQADDAFLAKLTAERQALNLPAPITTPQRQTDVRNFADDLQAGKQSAGEALRALDRWAQAAYQRPVSSWLVDCGPGENMKLPRALVDRPSAVVAFASAHFRPRSLTSDQCAVLVIAIEGTEPVLQEKI